MYLSLGWGAREKKVRRGIFSGWLRKTTYGNSSNGGKEENSRRPTGTCSSSVEEHAVTPKLEPRRQMVFGASGYPPAGP